MLFQYRVSMNDDDYLEFNKFYLLRSSYGVEQLKRLKRTVMLLMIAVAAAYLIFEGIDVPSLIATAVMLACIPIVNMLTPKIMISTLKQTINLQKKKGKLGYSPEALIELGEEYIIETTETSKIAQKYTVIEGISVVENRAIYIQFNAAMCFIIPLSVFGSREEYKELIGFLKTKCEKIDYYSVK